MRQESTARHVGERAGAAIRRVPPALLVLLALGLGLRIALAAALSPTVFNLADSADYVEMADGELFSVSTKPAGYSMLLAALHALSGEIAFTIWAQHLLGIGTALILYATVRRLGAPLWAALVPAAAVLLPIDQIFLEHALMTEAPFTFALVAMLYACVRTLEEPRPLAGPLSTADGWALLAGLALGLSSWLRPASAPLALVVVAWLALFRTGPLRPRLRTALLAAASTGAVILGYFAWHAAETDTFGFSSASGWTIYARVAPFADCTRFDPPAGTEELCEELPVAQRPGPDFYGHQPDSPAVQLFGSPPNGSEQLAEFARAVIFAQPFSYGEDVVRDTLRYFHPSLAPQPFSGVGYDVLDVERRAPGVEEAIEAVIEGFYGEVEIEVAGAASTLSDVQAVVRVHPKLLLFAFLFGGVAIWLGSGRVRAAAVLLVASSAVLLVVPTASAIWSARYAIPAGGPLCAAGALGLWCAAGRLRDSGRLRWSR